MGKAEIMLGTKLVGEIEGHFSVPSYQRGYRWGEAEVVWLLTKRVIPEQRKCDNNVNELNSINEGDTL